MLRERKDQIDALERDILQEASLADCVRFDFLGRHNWRDYPSRAGAIRRSRSMIGDIREQIPLLQSRIDANTSGVMEDDPPYGEDALDLLSVLQANLDIVSSTVDALERLGQSLAEGWDISW